MSESPTNAKNRRIREFKKKCAEVIRKMQNSSIWNVEIVEVIEEPKEVIEVIEEPKEVIEEPKEVIEEPKEVIEEPKGKKISKKGRKSKSVD